MALSADLDTKLQLAPRGPGCYLWKNAAGEIVYVGKAKNIFNRVHQYFARPGNARTARLVSEIADVSFISVRTENEALILESNLILKHQPRYNVLLKDNNGYQYIVVSNGPKPRLLYTRRYEPKKGKHYGPFASTVFRTFDVYNLLLRLFPLKPCSGVRGRACFYRGMGMCSGACVGEDTPERYAELKAKVDRFFRNGADEVLADLEKKERAAAERLDFEAAKRWLDLRRAAAQLSERQVVALGVKENADVLGFSVTDNYLTAVIFSYAGGKLLSKHAVTAEFADSAAESLESYVFRYYAQNARPDRLYAALDEDSRRLLQSGLGFDVVCPAAGKMRKIVELAAHNARNEGAAAVSSARVKHARTAGANAELGELLGIEGLSRVEVFDNSNIFNVDRVAAMVAYVDGEPDKKAYRKYKIKLESSNSDYDYMREVIYRRCFRLLREQKPLPDLILVDGGAPQVLAASRALAELRLGGKVALAGLAKDDRHRTDALVLAEGQRIELDRHTPLYFLLANMQEEVHRFAISFFRRTNRKSHFASVLEGVQGLGKKRADKLLAAFGSVARMRAAQTAEIAQIVPAPVAEALKKKLEEETDD